MADQGQSGDDKTFQLQVITPEGIVFDARALALQATAVDGMLGVLAHHAPLVTPLVPGLLSITTQGGDGQLMAAGGGFLEVLDNQVRVLVDSAERPDEIDVERAELARKRAENRLSLRGSDEIDYARAQSALRRALARLRLKQGL